MKKIYLFLAMLFSMPLFAQTSLSTQAEVDNFSSSNVQGNILIGKSWGSSTDITNIQALSQLTSVSGNLIIKNNDMLTSLEGLDNLVSIGGSLEIEFNNGLTGLNGLGSLTTIGGRLRLNNDYMTDPTGMGNLNSVQQLDVISTPLTGLPFMQNITSLDKLYFSSTDLEDFTGLENLSSIENHFTLSNTSFINFAGLENLTSIGHLHIGNYYYDYYEETNFYSPNDLVSFEGLNNLESIPGYFSIIKADNLQDFTGLENLILIGESLEIAYNEGLVSLSGLDNAELGNQLQIHHNQVLSMCDAPFICSHIGNGGIASIHNNAWGCSNIPQAISSCPSTCPMQDIVLTTQAQVDDFNANYLNCISLDVNLTIEGADIENLNGLSYIQSISGDLLIQNNNNLIDLSGLHTLEQVGGNFEIKNNANLDAFNSLSSIDSISGNLLIQNNNKLFTPNGFDELKWINGHVEISNNGNLYDIQGFENLNFIGGHLDVSANDSLRNIAALDALTAIGDYFNISSNASLLHLNDLRDLTSIDSYLQVNDNASLTSLVGLQGIAPATINDLIIQNNPTLSECEIANICNYLNANGNATISGNATRCLDVQDVINSCENPLATCLENVNVQFLSQSDIENFVYTYPGCTEILGNVTIKNVNDLSDLSQLTAIRGNLVISDCTFSDFSGFDSLTLVEGTFSVRRTDFNSFSGLENLTGISGSFNVGGNGFTQDDHPSCAVDYPFEGSTVLTNFEGLENLQTIGGDFRVAGHSALLGFMGLNQLDSIGGTFLIIDNPLIENFTGLENLTTIGGLQASAFRIVSSIPEGQDTCQEYCECYDHSAYVGANISGFEGLNSLSTIKGNISIYNNDFLTDFSGLEALTTIEGSLYIGELWAWEGNDTLSTLSGLESLNYIGERIHIEANNMLTDIQALGNVNMQNLEYISIRYNANLAVCSMSSICNYLVNEGTHYLVENASGCNDAEEILSTCPEIAKVQPHIFYDINQNQIQDADEPINTDISVLISPDNYVVFANPENTDGFYLDIGSYTATLNIDNYPDWQLTTDSLSYFLNLEAGECDTITFGVYPIEQLSDIQTFVNSPPARCNEFITFDITTKNLGTTTASGTFWLEVDENVLATNFIDMPDTTVAPNLYGWFFEDLFPSQCLSRQIELQIPGPPDFPVGDYLFFDAYTNFDDENGEQNSQTFTYEAEVRCSFDPNDKLVNPSREGDYTLFDENIIYTIRFQNTGNDVAYDVVILDTLDTNLDLESFNVLGSSHADKLQTSMTTDGILTFEFRDIFLPDSTSNLEGSQGYVTYMISAIDGLAEDTPITNSAGIYFDFNPPVITNTTQNVMVSELPVVSTTLADGLPDFIITPNPSTGIFQVNGIPQGSYQIHDTAGRVIQSGEMENDLFINISQEARGVYFISIQMDDEVITKRIIKL